MQFWLQLKMLLWKNFTLKLRRPFVAIFEILIPLVLFMVLLGIRLRRQPKAVEENIFSVKALPSAGIIPLLQMFCPNKTQNEHGFLVFPESKTNELLENLTIILKNIDKNHGQISYILDNNDQMSYDDIIKELSNNQSLIYEEQVNDFLFRDLWNDPDAFRTFLRKNLSIPENLTDTFLNANVNGTEVIHRLDNHVSYNEKRGEFENRVDKLEKRLLFFSQVDPNFLKNKENVGKMIFQTLYPESITENPKSILKDVFFQPDILKETSCNESAFSRIIQIPNSPENQNALQKRLCNLTDEQYEALSREIYNQLNSTAVYDKMSERFSMRNKTQYEKYKKDADSLRKNVKLLQENEETLRAVFAIANLLKLNSSLADKLKQDRPKGNENVRLAREIWHVLRPVLCGPSQEVYEKDPCPDAMYYHYSNSKALEMMLYVMTNKPLILYSPNTTEVRKVVKRANWTFQAVADSIKAGHWWLRYSEKVQQQINSQNFMSKLGVMKGFFDNTGKDSIPDVFSNDQFDLLNGFNVTKTTEQLKFADQVVQQWLYRVENISLDVYLGFNNSAEMEIFAKNFSNIPKYRDSRVIAGIDFTNIEPDGSLPTHVEYKIRMNSTFTWDTTSVRNNYWQPGPECEAQPYYFYGFTWFQDIFDRAIVAQQVNNGDKAYLPPASYLQEIPYPCYMSDSFMFVIKHMVPLCMVVSWIYTVAITVESIVYEKERRLKEFMKMMGLSNIVHWVAWFITSLCSISITVALLTVILKLGKILTYSDPVLVWLFLMVFAVATIVFCFLISVFFSKAKLAAACGGIIYFLTYMPFVFISIREDAAQVKIGSTPKSFASLFSTTAFGLASRYFALYEEQSIGVQWSNINQSPLADDPFNILKIFYLLIIDTLLYAVLVWYIEAVHPGSYGLPRPWYFPIQASYWFGHNTHACSKLSNYLLVNDEDQILNVPGLMTCEREPVHLPLGAAIQELVKVYKNGTKRAVNKLTLNLFEGQITSFLGHNGAGKTTTMSLLTGLFPPTQGTAHIYGHDIRYDMDDIRKSLGFCPQHNVLFDKLSVEEHLWFYARLKGMQANLVRGEVDRLLLDLDLPGKRHNLVNTLSGGMKRKLSIAVAFVAKSRMVILDEPTAGVDPFARRAIWDLLIKYKKERTILLSTHFMDEADVLGDRIAIISDGKLQCVGSSLFLKTHFGDGYNLTLVKKSSTSTQNSFSSTPRGSVNNLHIGTPPTTTTTTLSCSPGTSSIGTSSLSLRPEILQRLSPRDSLLSTSENMVENITSFVKSYIPSAECRQNNRQEISFILPNNIVKKVGFGNFFPHLEENLDNLGLTSYGISETPLEEVFLKVTDLAEQDDLDSQVDRSSNTEEETIEVPVINGHLIDGDKDVEMVDLDDQTHGHISGSIDDVPLVGDKDGNDTELQNILEQSGSLQDGETTIVDDDNEHSHGKGAGRYVVTGAFLKLQQFHALIVKRFYQTRRNLKGLFSQVFLPSFFITIAMVFALSVPSPKDAPPLRLNTEMFHRPNYIPFGNEAKNDTTNRNLAFGLDNTLKLPSGIGSFCRIRKEASSWSNNTGYSYPCLFDRKKLSKKITRLFNTECANAVTKSKISNVYLCGGNVTNENIEGGDKKCHCSKDRTRYICAIHDPLPKQLIPATMDTLRNITGRNITTYLLYTTMDTRMKRYGGLIFGETVQSISKNFSEFQCVNINCESVKRLGVRNAVKALYNNKGYHSQPVYLNAMDNTILRHYIADNHIENPALYGISVINHPFNKSGDRLSEEYRRSGTNVVIAIFVIVAMSFVPAGFIVFLVTERSSNAKHIQFVSGVDPIIYWLSNYVWDMTNYMVPAAVSILILYFFQVPAYASPTNFPAVVCLFVLYGWSVTPLMYPGSFFFKVPSTAYVVMVVTNLFLGITTTVSTSILEIFINDMVLKRVNLVLGYISLAFPNYCLGRGLMNLAYNEYYNDIYMKTGQSYQVTSPFAWKVVTRNLVFMAIEGFLFFAITLLIEFKVFQKSKRLSLPTTELDDDEDVAEERERVLSGEADEDTICLKNLTKVYFSKKTGNHLAVDRLCLGIRQGECFGLLGVNGAGKTTTFKMLTGDTSVTSGEAFLNSFNVRKEILKVHRCIGYCPQFDALIDEMTGREHLTLYARLRGIPRKEIHQVVEWVIEKLCLTRFADTPSKTYSGGMKRKLSTAIALIGDPQIIFLDEPTTGMDPKARRFLWDTVLSIVEEGRSVILTSHSMEECEALCNRLAIMVNGQFKCLGSTQHLKNRFGNGYIITLRIKGDSPDLQHAINFFNDNFNQATLKERHHNMLQYQLPTRSLKLSEVFERIENHLDILEIEDYSVSQTTLDNVFINFAKQQTDEVEFKDKIGSRGSKALHKLCLRLGLLTSSRLRTFGDSTVHFTSINNEIESTDEQNLDVTFSNNSQLSFSPDVNV